MLVKDLTNKEREAGRNKPDAQLGDGSLLVLQIGTALRLHWSMLSPPRLWLSLLRPEVGTPLQMDWYYRHVELLYLSLAGNEKSDNHNC